MSLICTIDAGRDLSLFCIPPTTPRDSSGTDSTAICCTLSGCAGNSSGAVIPRLRSFVTCFHASRVRSGVTPPASHRWLAVALRVAAVSSPASFSALWIYCLSSKSVGAGVSPVSGFVHGSSALAASSTGAAALTGCAWPSCDKSGGIIGGSPSWRVSTAPFSAPMFTALETTPASADGIGLACPVVWSTTCTGVGSITSPRVGSITSPVVWSIG